MLEHTPDLQNLLVPKGSPLYLFISGLAVDLSIGCRDQFEDVREFLNRPRPRDVGIPVRRYSGKLKVSLQKVDGEYYRIEASEQIAISGENKTYTIPDLSAGDLEALFEGIGKALLSHKYNCRVR